MFSPLVLLSTIALLPFLGAVALLILAPLVLRNDQAIKTFTMIVMLVTMGLTMISTVPWRPFAAAGDGMGAGIALGLAVMMWNYSGWDTPSTTLGETRTPERTYLMYDEVTVASVIDPTLVKTESLIVDVDATPGINYGVSVGGRSVWPGAEGAQKMAVQHDIDWERFIRLFVDRVGAPMK